MGYQRNDFVEYQQKAEIALKHIMFKDWDPTFETLPYPPAIGKYALYKVDDVWKHVNYALEMVSDCFNSYSFIR